MCSCLRGWWQTDRSARGLVPLDGLDRAETLLSPALLHWAQQRGVVACRNMPALRTRPGGIEQTVLREARQDRSPALGSMAGTLPGTASPCSAQGAVHMKLTHLSQSSHPAVASGISIALGSPWGASTQIWLLQLSPRVPDSSARAGTENKVTQAELKV